LQVPTNFQVHDELNVAVSPINSVLYNRRENVKRSTREGVELTKLDITSPSKAAGSFDEGKTTEERKSEKMLPA
jgi:hypothetical protein